MNKNRCLFIIWGIVLLCSCNSFHENKVFGEIPDIVANIVEEVRVIKSEKLELDSIFQNTKRGPVTSKEEQERVEKYMSKLKELGNRFRENEKKWNSIIKDKFKKLNGRKIPYSESDNKIIKIDSIVIYDSDVKYIKAKLYFSVKQNQSLNLNNLSLYYLLMNSNDNIIDKSVVNLLMNNKSKDTIDIPNKNLKSIKKRVSINIPLFKKCKELIYFDEIKFVSKEEYGKILN